MRALDTIYSNIEQHTHLSQDEIIEKLRAFMKKEYSIENLNFLKDLDELFTNFENNIQTLSDAVVSVPATVRNVTTRSAFTKVFVESMEMNYQMNDNFLIALDQLIDTYILDKHRGGELNQQVNLNAQTTRGITVHYEVLQKDLQSRLLDNTVTCKLFSLFSRPRGDEVDQFATIKLHEIIAGLKIAKQEIINLITQDTLPRCIQHLSQQQAAQFN